MHCISIYNASYMFDSQCGIKGLGVYLLRGGLMRKAIYCIISGTVFVCLILFSQKGYSADNGPERITLANNGVTRSILFDHRAHQRITECASCHHFVDDSGIIVAYSSKLETGKCVACHNRDFNNEKLNTFKKVGHVLCRECHAANGLNSSCKTCHNITSNKKRPKNSS